MREIVHLQAGQCGNQIGAKVRMFLFLLAILFFSAFLRRLSNLDDAARGGRIV